MSTLKTKQSKNRGKSPITTLKYTEKLLATALMECQKGSELQQKTQALLNGFETRIDTWLKDKNRHHRVQCRKGCGFCCNMLNWISLAEAAVLYPIISHHERQHFIRLDGVLLSLAQKTPEEELFEAYRNDVGFCPLFDAERSCRIHPFRPLSCRSVFSFFPPILCRVDLPRRYGLDRLQAIIDRRPSDEYFETPFALTPILWKEKAAQQLRTLMISKFDFAIEGAFPAMIRLIDLLVQPSRSQARTAGFQLETWLENRIQTDLVSITSL